MKDGFLALPGKIGDTLHFLFVPEEGEFDDLTEKIKSIYLIRQAMQLRDEIISLFEDLGFYGIPDDAPEISFKVSTEGTKSLAQFETEIRISLDWYEPYKADIDAVLSALMLLFYMYRLFVNLPAIINGTGAPAASIVKDVLEGGKDDT